MKELYWKQPNTYQNQAIICMPTLRSLSKPTSKSITAEHCPVIKMSKYTALKHVLPQRLKTNGLQTEDGLW